MIDDNQYHDNVCVSKMWRIVHCYTPRLGPQKVNKIPW